ncbi:MAG: aminodeoxychorismate/anthranilate synthase component II [Proteobacteria bacterium]|nr:aminodeoxychorismate/anthranilate synthase component II [Pseudomonadota bacterium]
MKPSLFVLDNYDSFTYNLVQMFKRYPLDINVFRSDKISIETIKNGHPDYILISPGPKNPEYAGISVTTIQTLCKDIPILGVCLGMQCINEAFGGKTVRAPLPVHGKTSEVLHAGNYLFKGLPSPVKAARYHSLMTSPAGHELVVTAKSPDGVIMGLSHPRYPLHGVQFHPESFLTEKGHIIIENFLKLGPFDSSRN